MKQLIQISLLLLTLTLLYACGEKDLIPVEETETPTTAPPNTLTDPPFQLSFDVARSNSDNNYESQVLSFELVKQESEWSDWKTHHDSSILLTREISFDAALANGDTVRFGFWFKKCKEDTSSLELTFNSSENTISSYKYGTWLYTSIVHELQDFYQDYDEVRVTINNNVIFNDINSPLCQITHVERCLVDGIERNYITIEFEGTAFGWYDPTGIHQEVFQLSNGRFEGVIE